MKEIFLPKQEHNYFINLIHLNLCELIKRHPIKTNIELYWELFDFLFKSNKRIFIYPTVVPYFGYFSYIVKIGNESEIKFLHSKVNGYKVNDYILFVENLEDDDILFPYLYLDGIMYIGKIRFMEYDNIRESEILRWKPVKENYIGNL